MEHIRQLQTHPWLNPSHRDQEPFIHDQRPYNSKSCKTFVVHHQHAIHWHHMAWICMSGTQLWMYVDSIYTLSLSMLPTGQQLSLTMYELMMSATCVSSGLIMHGDNLPVCCLSKCRGYIILWEWVPSMWKDGDRLSAQLLPVLPLPVSRAFLRWGTCYNF